MIEMLPESSGKILGVRASDRLTDDDYRDVWLPKLEEILEAQGAIRILMHMDDDYRGWTAGAMWEDAKFGLKHIGSVMKGEVEKVALVGGSDWAMKSVELFGYVVPGEIEKFASTELDDAWRWIRT